MNCALARHRDRARRVVPRLLRRRGRARQAAVVAVRRVDRHDRRRAVDRSATWSRSAGTATSRSGRATSASSPFDPWTPRSRSALVDVRVVDLLHLLQHHRRGRLGEQPGLRRPLRGRAGRAAEHACGSRRPQPKAIAPKRELPPAGSRGSRRTRRTSCAATSSRGARSCSPRCISRRSRSPGSCSAAS